MNTFKESIFVYTWFDGTIETIIAHFDNHINSENLKNSFKTFIENYKLMSIKSKPKQHNEIYPYFISIRSNKTDKLVDPNHKELMFFLI